jgi:hypothetical protein
MSRYEHWKRALLEAQSPREVEAIVKQCRDSLAAGDKVGWSLAARDALLEPDLRLAAVTLEREDAAFNGDPESALILHEVSTLYREAARRLWPKQA